MTAPRVRMNVSRPRRSTGRGFALVIGLLALPFTCILYGATLAKLWEWFVSDTFGVLAISTAQAIGLSSVVTFVTYQLDARNDDENDPVAATVSIILTSLFRSVIALGFGLIVTRFL